MVRVYSCLRPMNESQSPRFYFALPRLLALLRNGDTRRAEINGAEAWAGNIAIFAVSYLFFARFVVDHIALWLAPPALIALAFLVLLFWLLVLYLNSLILELVRRCGLFRSLPQRRGQAVLLATVTTAMALQLAQTRSLTGEIASIWLVALAMNLGAALILAFRDGNTARS